MLVYEKEQKLINLPDQSFSFPGIYLWRATQHMHIHSKPYITGKLNSNTTCYLHLHELKFLQFNALTRNREYTGFIITIIILYPLVYDYEIRSGKSCYRYYVI